MSRLYYDAAYLSRTTLSRDQNGLIEKANVMLEEMMSHTCYTVEMWRVTLSSNLNLLVMVFYLTGGVQVVDRVTRINSHQGGACPGVVVSCCISGVYTL